MEGDRQSLGALEVENTKREGEEQDNEEEFDEENDDDDDDDENEDERRRLSCELESSIGAELRTSQLEALDVPSSLKLWERDLHSDIDASSHLLSEVPVEFSLLPLEHAELKDQIGGTCQEAFVRVTSQALEDQTENQLQSPRCPTSFELLTTSVTQSIPSAPSPILPEERLSPVADGDSMCVSGVDKLNNNSLKTVLPVHTLKSSSTDRYNWRKYGQNQVKSPQGSRSYYKCTSSGCYAKKIECCDHSNRVREIIYRSRHNHDPRKISCTRENRLALSAVHGVGSNKIAHPIREVDDLEPPTCSVEAVQKTSPIPGAKQQNSGSSGEDIEVNVEEEHVYEPEPKQRVKKSSSVNSSSILKPEKKHKLIVHAAANVGISGDGYRWRKYGQKMVKGNPYPRNYYRCTSAGCFVRKHIERAVDDTNAAIITYKGIHDHDMPVPKKRHGPPSGSLVAATASASMNNLQLKKSDTIQSQISATQWSVDKEGELTGETLDLGGNKEVESARTLLSIGFKIKPC